MDKFEYKKAYGQNFMRDENIINKIVDSAKIDKDTLLIEIGPGAGSFRFTRSSPESSCLS